MRSCLLGIPASMVIHGVGLLLVFTLVRHESAPSIIEIDLLEPVVASGGTKKMVSIQNRLKGEAAREAFRRPTSIPLSPKVLEAEPTRLEEFPAATTDPPSRTQHSLPQPLLPSPQSPQVEAHRNVSPLPEVVNRSLREASSGQGGGSGARAMLSPGEGRSRSDGSEGGRSAGTSFTGSGGQGETALARPSEGDGRLLPEYDRFHALIRQRIQESLLYPAAARRRELTGTVLLEITLHSDGRVGRVAVLRSSNHQLLDEAAVETVTRAAPFSFLSALPVRQIMVRLPIVFEIR